MMFVVLCSPRDVVGAMLRAEPSNYRDVVRSLQPGDTALLLPGIYRDGLDIEGLRGTAAAPIVIRGEGDAHRPVFTATADRNTISIIDAAYVTVANLDLIGAGIPVDAVKAEGHARFAHHITIEGLHISGYGADQQNVGISTKCPAWNWTIRGNVIVGAGTGLYLGNSDGTAPFVRGVIENNLIVGTRGYSAQVKHQNAWPDIIDVGSVAGATMIRYNTFVKDERSSSGDLARPNLLLGHWPLRGRGTGDRYLVYGNLFVDNPHEFLMQAEGNVVIYNNVFINRYGDGLAIREHNDLPRRVDVFHNTIVASRTGILLRNGSPRHRQTTAGNAVFSARSTPLALQGNNHLGDLGEAARTLRNTAAGIDGIDLAPLPNTLRDPDCRPGDRGALPEVTVDFDRTVRSRPIYGAYAGGDPAERRRFREVATALRAAAGIPQ